MDATGSFSACQLCQTKHCCTKLGVDGPIGRAVLTPSEKIRIERATGLRAEEFSVPATDKGSECSYIVSRPDGRCTFLDDRKMCTIYDLRPFDCRFFPFDIARLDDEYYWVVYDYFCQLKAGNWEEQVTRFEKEILPAMLPYLHDIGLMTRDRSVGQQGEWRPLRRVNFAVIPSAAE